MVRWGYPARDFSESRPAPFRKLLFAGVPCPLTHDGADPSRVKQGKFMAYLEQGPFPAKSIFYLLNMDTQDKQDEKLLHRKLTGSMIECVFVENLRVLRGPSRTPFEFFQPLGIPWRIHLLPP